MKTKTDTPHDATPAPEVVTGGPDATGPAPAGPAAGTKARPPHGHRPPGDGGSAEVEPDLPFHPVAEMCPWNAAKYEEIKEDIRKNGLLLPIWTYQGKIIDGRHRYRACRELGIKPEFQEWDGTGSLVDFVLSLNVRRRQLSESQLALVAARAIPLYKDEARERMRAGKAADPPLHEEESHKGEAAAVAASKVGVSRDMVYKAQLVLAKGVPELQEAVDDGQVSVSAAGLSSAPPS
jgi:hypothetical protein